MTIRGRKSLSPFKHALTFAFAVASAMTCGCSSEPKSVTDLPPELRMSMVVSFVNPSAKMPASGRFFLMRGTAGIPENRRIDWQKLDDLIRAAVRDGLERKGYSEGSSVQNDVLVGYAVLLKSAMDDQQVSALYEYGTGWAAGADPSRKYDKGMIVMDVFNGRTGQIIWRGAVQANADLELSEDIRRQRVRMAVAQLLSRWPEGHPNAAMD